MESRFLRFGRRRRDRASSPKPDLEFSSIAYVSAATPEIEPIFIHQPLGKSGQESKRIDDQSLLLRGFAYDSLPTGKTPQFVGTAVKGNGPVKLQTSRRLSSGELLVTTQHNQRTLEDIREGDYIVGQKNRHDVASHSPKLGGLPNPPTTSRLSYSLRSRPSTSRSTRTNRDSNWSAPITPTSPVRQSSLSVASSPPAGLGISSSTIIQSSPYEPSSASSPELTNKRPLSKANAEQNATIAALWRAEYGRLVKLYGQDGVDRDILQGGKPTLARRPSHTSIPETTKSSPIPLDPLPQPGLEGVTPKRASNGSSRSSTFRDDSSEVSSQNRESGSSSWAASSSYTTPPSVGEAESPTTREDIRKMIEDIRSNYLHAIETQSPTMLKKKSTKKRRKPKLGASPLVNGFQASTDRQTWHGEDVTQDSLDGQLKRRTTSPPVRAFGRLSPIEASPRRPDMSFDTSVRSTPDLKRADSMTLGSLMLQIPENASEPLERPQRLNKDVIQRPNTVATSDDRSWLHLSIPTTSLLPELSRTVESTLNLEKFVTPRYVPKGSTTMANNKPATTIPHHHLRYSQPKDTPQRPAPPSTSLAELVNFI